MTKLLTSNSKLRRDAILSFGIPALQYVVTKRFLSLLHEFDVKHSYKLGDVIVICKCAGECAGGCYAQMGAYTYPVVIEAQEYRLALSMSKYFVSWMNIEIRKKRRKRVRIHDAGDFYSVEYFNKWLRIMHENPTVQFYAYTKLVKFFKGKMQILPKNFHVIFSEGGKQDEWIDLENDRHSRVFSSVRELKKEKYVNASESDLPSAKGNFRIGLVYHGYKSREWTTNK